MNPSITLDTALLQPGIADGTKSYLKVAATELLVHLQEKNESEYSRFFMGGKPRDVFPRRAGYYVGILIADDLSRRHNLSELTNLKGSALHDAIVSELESLKTVEAAHVADGSRKARQH
jgi:uncharacterized protein YjaZ